MRKLIWTVPVIQDPDNPEELLLDLGTELCADLGWQEGDTIQWNDNKDGTWTLTKKNTSTSGQTLSQTT